MKRVLISRKGSLDLLHQTIYRAISGQPLSTAHRTTQRKFHSFVLPPSTFDRESRSRIQRPRFTMLTHLICLLILIAMAASEFLRTRLLQDLDDVESESRIALPARSIYNDFRLKKSSTRRAKPGPVAEPECQTQPCSAGTPRPTLNFKITVEQGLGKDKKHRSYSIMPVSHSKTNGIPSRTDNLPVTLEDTQALSHRQTDASSQKLDLLQGGPGIHRFVICSAATFSLVERNIALWLFDVSLCACYCSFDVQRGNQQAREEARSRKHTEVGEARSRVLDSEPSWVIFTLVS